MAEKIGDAYVRIIANGDGLPASVRREMKKAEPEFDRAGTAHGKAYSNAIEKEVSKSGAGLDAVVKDFQNSAKKIAATTPEIDKLGASVSRNGGLLRNFARDIDLVADRVAVGFGRGSRNNFLNFFGAAIGNTIGLTGAFARMGAGAIDAGKGVISLISNLKEGLKVGGIFETFAIQGAGAAQKLGTAFAGAAPALLAVGAAAAALIVIVPALASGISLLLGVVTALAASLTGALIGGLAALSSLLLPIGAGLAVLVLGIASLDKAAKKALSEAVKPLGKELDALGKVASDGLFSQIEPTVENLSRSLRNLRPLVGGIGEALADVGRNFSEALGGPGFKEFVDVMSGFLPNAIRTLGTVAQQTLAGIGGVFEALIPTAERFLGFLDRVTASFQEFANSNAGQTQLKNFFDDAADSAAALGDLLGALGGLIREVFSAGQLTGDNIITELADKVREFTNYLNRNPGVLQKWFGDAAGFARTIGNLAVEVGRLFDSLDTATGRDDITGFFSSLSEIVGGVATAFQALEDVFAAVSVSITGAVGIVSNAIQGIANLVTGDFSGALQNLRNLLADFLETVGGLAGVFDFILPGDADAEIQAFADTVRGAGVEIDTISGKTIDPNVNPEQVERFIALLGKGGEEADKVANQIIAPTVDPSGIESLLQSFDLAQEEIDRIRDQVIGPEADTSGPEALRTAIGQVLVDAGLLDESQINPAVDVQGLDEATNGFSSLLLQGETFAASNPTTNVDAIPGAGLLSMPGLLAGLTAGIDGVPKGFVVVATETGFKLVEGKAEDVEGAVTSIPKGWKVVATESGFKLVEDKADDTNDAVRSVPTKWNVSFGATVLGSVASAVRRVKNAIAEIGFGRNSTGGTITIPLGLPSRFAAGGIPTFDGFQKLAGGYANSMQLAGNAWVGEAGREAVVPLDRPLDQVDPSVRWLSAIAQGMSPSSGGGMVQNNNLTVITPTADPVAVAYETVGQLALQSTNGG